MGFLIAVGISYAFHDPHGRNAPFAMPILKESGSVSKTVI